MSFLEPILLVGLPLALLPVVIHLINQHRHRTVKWAAMMFLLDAKKMTKGIARLRQVLILAMRVIAVAAIIFVAGRPLAGGWLGFAGGKADTLLILLDRSASMEQQNLETGLSKRESALEKIAGLWENTGHRGETVLIDSATLSPIVVTDPESLADLPQTASTATRADIPALLEAALAYLDTDESGRTDVWLATDLRQNDWDTGSGRWQTIRSDLSSRETVRLFILTYPEEPRSNFSVSVENAERKRAADGFRLVMDLTIKRRGGDTETPATVPVEITINGTRTVEEMVVDGEELVRLGYAIPLGSTGDSGWGRIDLPADDNPADNSAFFVFDEPAVRRSVIVSNDPVTSEAIRAAAGASVESGTTYEAEIFTPDDIASIPWESTALLFWQAPLPAPGSTEDGLLRQHVQSGRSIVFLPSDGSELGEWFGFRWAEFTGETDSPPETGWWRTDSGLLANTRNGEPLPIGELAVFRSRRFDGEFQPLLKLESGEPVIAKLLTETPGAAYIWGTLPRADWSTLASDGVAFFVMIHRALAEGINAVSSARSVEASLDALSEFEAPKLLSSSNGDEILGLSGLIPAAFQMGSDGEERRLLALNRPDSESESRLISESALEALLEGVEFNRIDENVDSGSSLASEIWKAFLVIMALALLLEAALCLPPPAEESRAATAR